MGTINTFNLYPITKDVIDKAATKAKEGVCSATEMIKHKLSINQEDKTSKDPVCSINCPSEVLLKKSPESGVEFEKSGIEK
ncbi:hypothetical protein ACH3XW_0570 [Acanthocheilonema viteae]